MCIRDRSHAITCLKLRQVGQKKEPVVCRYSTVQNLEVTIRTAHGDTPIHTDFDIYAVPLNNPYQGSLQGGADSMTDWAIVGSEIIQMMREVGHGVAFR